MRIRVFVEETAARSFLRDKDAKIDEDIDSFLRE